MSLYTQNRIILRWLNDESICLSLASFSCSFCVISSYSTLKPSRTALVIETWGIQNLPFVDLLMSLAMFALAHTHAHRANRLSPVRLTTTTLFAGTVLLFTAVVSPLWPSKVTALYQFAVGAMVNLYAVAAFWSLCNAAHGNVVGRRLYGLAGAGGSVGGVLGASLAATVQPFLGDAGVVLLSGALLALSIPFALAMAHLAVRPLTTSVRRVAASSSLTDVRLLLQSRRALAITLLVIAMGLAGELMRWVTNRLIEGCSTQSTLTTRLAHPYLYINLLGVLVQLVGTTFMLRCAGIERSLLVTPLLAVTCGACLLTGVAIPIILALCIVYLSCRYTLNQSAKELLYTDQSADTMYKGKGFIDTAVSSFANSLGAGCVWLAVARCGLDAGDLGPLLLCLSGLWMVASLAAARAPDDAIPADD